MNSSTGRATTDEFVNRSPQLMNSSTGREPQLVERIIEIIIASTPHELLQKHMLDQDKDYIVGNVLIIEARKYEAVAVGKQSLQTKA